MRFVNAVHGGVIWSKAHPVHPDDARLELSTILTSYADSLGGAGLYAEGSVFGIEQPKERQFTTFVSNPSVIDVGPHKAIAATIELAEVAKLAQNPTHRDSKVRVVITKIQYFRPLHRREQEAIRKGRADQLKAQVVNRDGRDLLAAVSLLVVGYYNDATRFDDSLGAFDSFVKSLQFDPAVSAPYPELQIGRIDVPEPPKSTEEQKPPAPDVEPPVPSSDKPVEESAPVE